MDMGRSHYNYHHHQHHLHQETIAEQSHLNKPGKGISYKLRNTKDESKKACPFNTKFVYKPLAIHRSMMLMPFREQSSR